MKQEELLKIVFALNEENGNITDICRDGKGDTAVFNINQIPVKYIDLLRAAPIMYETITRQLQMVQSLIVGVGLSQLSLEEKLKAAPPLRSMENMLLLTKKVAEEGIEKVANELRLQQLSKNNIVVPN